MKIKLEKQILKILKIPKNKDDLDFIKDAVERYPGLDYLDEAKKMMAWLRDNPRIKNKKPRLRFRNWCRIAWEGSKNPNQHYSETQKLLSEIRKKLSEKFKMNPS